MMTHALMAAADMAASSLVAAAWESVILLLAVSLCLRLLPGLSAATRSVVWTGTLVLAVVLPWVPSAHSGSLHDAAAAVSMDESWGLGLVCLWSMLSAVRGIALLRSATRLYTVVRRSTPIDVSTASQAILTAGSRRAALCLSEDVDRPSVAGFFCPRVLMPTALYAQLQPAELEQILRHEMEHIHRGDDWTNLLQKLSLVLFPLNPALLWLDARLSAERELACDDSVLRQTRARKAYAACLANLATHSIVRRGTSLALGAWERQTELARRIHRILAWQDTGLSRRSATAVTAVLLLSLTAATVELGRSPRLVSFGPLPTVDSLVAAVPEGMPGGMRMATSVRGKERSRARPLLVRAEMPTEAFVAPLPAFRHAPPPRRRSRAVAPAVERVARRFAGRQPAHWVMLTAGRGTDLPARLALVVAEQGTMAGDGDTHSVPRYAAVATRNGWLIFQL